MLTMTLYLLIIPLLAVFLLITWYKCQFFYSQRKMKTLEDNFLKNIALIEQRLKL